SPRPSIGMPDIAFFLHRWGLGRSRATGECWLSVLGSGDTREAAQRDAEDRRAHVLAAIEAFERQRPSAQHASFSGGGKDRGGICERVPRREYMDRVGIAKRHIEEGDAFEICLTGGFEARFSQDPWLLWE